MSNIAGIGVRLFETVVVETVHAASSKPILKKKLQCNQLRIEQVFRKTHIDKRGACS